MSDKPEILFFLDNIQNASISITGGSGSDFRVTTNNRPNDEASINLDVNELAKLHQGIGKILIDNMKVFKTQIAVPMPNGMEVKDIQFGRSISEEAVRNSYQEKYGGNVTILSVTEVAEEVAEQHYRERVQQEINSHSGRSILIRKLTEALMNR